ncbi:MAG: N-acetyl-gamma-glutamyl-phosphate reductase [Deltaproteobacteria bacterium]|nr:MAG: N-acetyl-gamma-glutamyl-phosphate reductase [Deltaproteobacteria bacterium]
MGTAKTIAVGIAGVRGYKGIETARLIARHPGFRVVMVASDVVAGGRLSQIDPDLARDGAAQAVGYNDTVSAAADYGVELMFLATRPSLCSRLASDLHARGIRSVDLSGAHCIKNGDAHAEAYGFAQVDPELSAKAVYGLTELADPEALRAAALVANPTSWATAALLPLKPLVRAGIVAPESVVVDIKAGTSASGRRARISLLFSEIADDCFANKIDRHPHTPEVMERLAIAGGPDFRFTLVSHLVPISRGMLATCYLRVAGATSVDAGAAQVRAMLREQYRDAPFIRVADRAEDVHLKDVVGTNRCVLGAAADPYGDRVVVQCAIDNMLKGTAGQAIQNANLMFGFEPTEALRLGTGGQP